jgi:HAMP domain-containing protein
VVTIGLVNWWIYAALGGSVLAVSAAAIVLAVRVLEAWRSLKRLRRRLAKELDHVNELSARAADGAARAGEQERLGESLGRLRSSLAQLAILRKAFDDATGPLRRVVALYLRA